MRRRRKKARLLIRMGLVLLTAALALTGYNLYDAYRAGQDAQASAGYLEALLKPQAAPGNVPLDVNGQVFSDVSLVVPQSTEPPAPTLQPVQEDGQTEALPQEEPSPTPVPTMPPLVEIPDYVLNPNMEMPTVTYEGQKYIGLLEIPALDLKLPIISQWSYPRLKKAPCRYVGSPYKNNLVIAAHNYDAHFGRLKDLNPGAAVIFTDVDGNVFNYRVELRETLNPGDISYMKNSGWDLSLFTCTPGGSYRVTVRCSLK